MIDNCKKKIRKSKLFKFIYPIYTLFPYRKIIGKNNSITNKSNFYPRAIIRGDNNTIIIEKDCILINVKIYQRGNECKLILHKGCVIKNTNFFFEDRGGLIEIGEKTTMKEQIFL